MEKMEIKNYFIGFFWKSNFYVNFQSQSNLAASWNKIFAQWVNLNKMKLAIKFTDRART